LCKFDRLNLNAHINCMYREWITVYVFESTLVDVRQCFVGTGKKNSYGQYATYNVIRREMKCVSFIFE